MVAKTYTTEINWLLLIIIIIIIYNDRLADILP